MIGQGGGGSSIHDITGGGVQFMIGQGWVERGEVFFLPCSIHVFNDKLCDSTAKFFKGSVGVISSILPFV